ncbi:hypothetical protein ACFW9U_26740 [Rhodococcus aetherivorans]
MAASASIAGIGGGTSTPRRIGWQGFEVALCVVSAGGGGAAGAR